MVPAIVAVVVFIALRVTGALGVRYFNDWRASLRWAMAVMFLFTASAHWGVRRPDLIAMVPPFFPRPDLLVTLTGVLEIAGAIGLMIRRTSRAAAAGLTLMLIAMFPANVYAAQRNLAIGGKPVTPLPQRTAIQVAFVAATAAIAVTRARSREATKDVPVRAQGEPSA